MFHVWINHNLFIPSCIDGHLTYFQFGAIINKVAMNICVQTILMMCVFISLEKKISKCGNARSWGWGTFNIIRKCQVVLQSTNASLYIPTNCVLVSLYSLHIYFNFFVSHSNGCAVVFHSSFNWQFLMINNLEHVIPSYLCVYLYEVSISVFCSIFRQVVILNYWVVVDIYTFWI